MQAMQCVRRDASRTSSLLQKMSLPRTSGAAKTSTGAVHQAQLICRSQLVGDAGDAVCQG